MRLDHLLSMENVVVTQKVTAVDGDLASICCSIFSDRVKIAISIALEVGAVNAQGPPVPIPNTEVKLCSAEDT